jgi:hypothetical protein
MRQLLDVMILLPALWAMSLNGQTKSVGQTKQHSEVVEQFNTGVLALLADDELIVIIDGADGGKTSTGKVLALKLVAGQHFVELRDSAGQKKWEKIVTIPTGTQVAEKIDIHQNAPTSPSVQGSPVVPSPQPAKGPPQPEDYLNTNDEQGALQHSVEVYLSRNGLRTSTLNFPDGTHALQMSFRGQGGQPDFAVYASILPTVSLPPDNFRQILLSLRTLLAVRRSESLTSAILSQNGKSSCAWSLDPQDRLMCSATITLPNPQYSVPSDQVLLMVRLLTYEWSRFYPTIKLESK